MENTMEIIKREMELWGDVDLGPIMCCLVVTTDNAYCHDERGSGWEITASVKLSWAKIGGYVASRYVVAEMIGADNLDAREAAMAAIITEEKEAGMMDAGTLTQAPALHAAGAL